MEQHAYLTPKGAIALYYGEDEELYTYGHYDEFDAAGQHLGLQAQVASALGQKFTEELDI